MHTVAVLALDHVVAFDLAIAVEVFSRAPLADGTNGYRVLVCGVAPVVSAGPLSIGAPHGLDAVEQADTVVVPGCVDLDAAATSEVVAALRQAHARGARIASICTGAFTVAAAGLLDGRRATTHWVVADLFRARHPEVHLDPDVLYVDDGQVLTSAGASSGLDLCLHMVATDHGAAVAAGAARLAVAPLHRSGGQAQFIIRNELPATTVAEHTTLDAVLAWIEQNAHRELALADIARHAAMSIRTLNRRFQAETGQTPMQWVTGVRVRHAQQLLENTAEGVEKIGRQVGFTSSANFRDQFRRLTGVAPQTYRSTFRDRLAG